MREAQPEPNPIDLLNWFEECRWILHYCSTVDPTCHVGPSGLTGRLPPTKGIPASANNRHRRLINDTEPKTMKLAASLGVVPLDVSFLPVSVAADEVGAFEAPDCSL
jgi:hypothetical protein